jgi:IS30 family transposase
MRDVREILGLTDAGVSQREIARRLGVVPSTVRETLRRFAAAGLTWPLGAEVTDAVLEARLYANNGTKRGHRRLAERRCQMGDIMSETRAPSNRNGWASSSEFAFHADQSVDRRAVRAHQVVK